MNLTRRGYHVLILTALVIGAVIAVLAGCAQADHGTQDAPPDQHYTDDTRVQIINMPDHYPNIAIKCDHHGHRLYATTRGDQAALQIVTDPKCPSDWPSG